MSNIVTNIELLRSDGRGLNGTWANAHHHAHAIRPFIARLEGVVQHLGFAIWRQGHNVHEFVTIEGTRYTLRAFIKNGAYFGVRLALRLSRSQEVRLIDITDPDDCWRLVDVMRMLAEPAKGEDSGVMLPSEKAA